MTQANEIPPELVLDRANVSFLSVRDVFSNVVNSARVRGYQTHFDDGFVTLLQRSTLPRFFFSSEYRVVSASEALNAIATAPPREIIIEQQPAFIATPNTPDDPAVYIEAYRANSVTLVIEAPRAGLVYASENYFNGWTALVNGNLAPILLANYAFRAVAVPAGHLRIEFRYWPPGLTTGLALTALSSAVLVALVVKGVLPRLSSRP